MNKHQKKARIALRKDELKKQEEKYSNLMLFTTIEAMALFFGILLIYKGCMSVPAVLYMRPILLTLTILSALSVIWIAYMIYGKKKDWTAHGVFAVFLTFLFALMRFGPNTRYAIFVAALCAAIYIVAAFVYFFIRAKK